MANTQALHEIEKAVVRYLEQKDRYPNDETVRLLYFEAHPFIPADAVVQEDVDVWANECIDKHDKYSL